MAAPPVIVWVNSPLDASPGLLVSFPDDAEQTQKRMFGWEMCDLRLLAVEN
jgi:hypothetical protein